MKKKIILFLSFLIIAMYLTGCSTKVTQEKIDEMKQIAENIRNNNDNYQLPEGYSYKYELEDSTKSNVRIVIMTEGDNILKHELRVTFDVLQEEIQMVKCEETYNADIIAIIVVLIFCVVCCKVIRGNKNKKSN